MASGKGLTEFRLKLTLTAASKPASAATVPRPKVARALAIEDEAYNRHVLGYFLSQFGYEVDWAVDGASALERIRNVQYDLVLTDFMLPDTTGPELADDPRGSPRSEAPDLIAVTAYSTRERIAEAKAAGIRQFVTKPIDRRKLEAAILGVDSPATAVTLRTPEQRPSEIQCDFAPLLGVENGRQILAEYADALSPTWSEVLIVLDDIQAGRGCRGAGCPCLPVRILVSVPFLDRRAVVHPGRCCARDERHEDTSGSLP